MTLLPSSAVSGRERSSCSLGLRGGHSPLILLALSEQRQIMADLGALRAELAALKRLQAETAGRQGLHPPLDALLPAILDRAFKGES